MTRASTATFTPLDEVARIAGINPVHFSGAYAGDIAWQPCGVCNDLWAQYAWQTETGFARENLARTIAEAEEQLSNLLGHSIVPTLKKKSFPYLPQSPQLLAKQYFNRLDALSLSLLNGRRSGVQCLPLNCALGAPAYYIGPHIAGYKPKRWAEVITADVDDFTLTYKDDDGDGFAEVAEIVFSLTTQAAACNIGLFTYGYLGSPTWRIRPVKSVSVVLNENTSEYDYAVRVDAWQLIRPELWEDPPRGSSGDGRVVGNMTQCAVRAIDMLGDGVFVEKVTVALHIDDPAYPLVTFRFEQGVGGCCSNTNCLACTARAVPGCYVDLARSGGFVVPIPATYSAEDGWCVANAFSCCGVSPGTVEISYWDGLERDYVLDATCGVAPSQAIRQIVMLLAISRAQLGHCDCDCNAGQAWKKLSEDLTETKGAGRYLSFGVIDNYFGLSRGEIMAYQRYRAMTIAHNNVSYGAY